MSIDPLHHQVEGPVRYSRINNAEVLPGVMTAASWSFWDQAVEVAFRRAVYDLGVYRAAELAVPSDPAHRLRAVFFGRVATNMSHHHAVGLRMPGFLQTAFVVHLFADETEAGMAAQRSRAWLWRMPWLVLRLPATLRAEHHAAKLWWRRATDPVGAPDDIADATGLLRTAHARFERAMTLNIATSLLSSAPVQQIMAMAKAAARPELGPAVIAGYGTEEALMAQRLAAIAPEDVPTGGETVEAFLADFGFHGQAEGQLHRTSWREAPEQVRARAESVRGGVAAGRSPEAVRAAQQDAERALLAAATSRTRLSANLWLARRLAPLREITKAWYLMTIDAGRFALRRIGGLALDQDLLDDAEDVFHLTLDEIFAGPSGAWREIAQSRRRAFERNHRIDIPERFVGMPEPVTLDQVPTDADGRARRTLSGIGVSVGVAEGPARVVREVDGVDDLCEGEVLVCRSTDPSWAPAFMLASAVVIDIGSMLSHGAIVARELGLPCVVNAGNATSLIRTGDRVRVDGSTGQVEIAAELEPSVSA